jgi:large repetitive protein
LGYMFVSVLGDTDGDGVPDIFASDWSDASKGPRTGRVYIYSGRTGRRLYTLTGETAGEGFGTTQSVAGDVDGDGMADLIVGSWQYSAAADGGGRAYLYDGTGGRLLGTYTCRIPGDTFGFDAVGMGVTDDAGEAELLITSAWSGVHGHHSGRIFLISSGVHPRVHRFGKRWRL